MAGMTGRRVLFIILTAIIVLIISGCINNPSQGYSRFVPGETRAIWVERWYLNSPESINEIIQTAKFINVDTLFIQVNGTSQAYYESNIVPKAPGIDDGFDPLDYFLDSAAKAGINVHAWINIYTLSYFSARPGDPEHVMNKNPHWVLKDSSGRTMLEYTRQLAEEKYLFYIAADPALPEVRQYYLDLIMEVVNNYDVQGIHLDYIRYPGKGYGYYFNTSGMTEGDWKRLQVTTLVNNVYNIVKEENHHIQISAAVFADYWSAYNYYYQEWKEWVKEDILDFVVLMAYNPSPYVVYMQVHEAVRTLGSSRVYAGIGVYQMEGQIDNIIYHISRARQAGASGITLFSYGSLVGCQETIYALRNGPFNLEDN